MSGQKLRQPIIPFTDLSITVKGSKLTYRQIIAQDVRALVRHFRQEERYIPFKQVK